MAMYYPSTSLLSMSNLIAFRVGFRAQRVMYVPLQVAQVTHDRCFYLMTRHSMSIGKIMEETWTLVDSSNLMGSLYQEGFSSDKESLHEVASGHPS